MCLFGRLSGASLREALEHKLGTNESTRGGTGRLLCLMSTAEKSAATLCAGSRIRPKACNFPASIELIGASLFVCPTGFRVSAVLRPAPAMIASGSGPTQLLQSFGWPIQGNQGHSYRFRPRQRAPGPSSSRPAGRQASVQYGGRASRRARVANEVEPRWAVGPAHKPT